MTRSKLLKANTHRRVVVTLKSGDAYDGLLVAFDGVVITLRQSSIIGTAGAAVDVTAVDGVLLVPWDHVAYMQIP